MSLSPRRVRSKIKTVGNIKKITAAMEAVSASKARRAARSAESARRYSAELATLASYLSQDESIRHPYFKKKSGEKVLVVLVSSDKGLCGGFNAHVFKKAIDVRQTEDHVEDMVVVGKRGERFARADDWNMLGSFVDLPHTLSIDDVRGVLKVIRDAWESGEYKRVMLIYTHYTSALVQTPQVKQLLPFKPARPAKAGLGVDLEEGKDEELEAMLARYLFEPGEEEVLNNVLPRLLEGIVFQALLESRASEHSARMIAMRNATDNAKELVDDLTLLHNRGRQAAVTSEIAEIAAGAEAVG